uniref:Uncharacterized protein n=1 Tax=Octopus bimaculoides TaxID=37653 RepID=A0A0L8I6E5_OCTBM
MNYNNNYYYYYYSLEYSTIIHIQCLHEWSSKTIPGSVMVRFYNQYEFTTRFSLLLILPNP